MSVYVTRLRQQAVSIFSIFTLLALITYALSFIFIEPYFGIWINFTNGVIEKVYITSSLDPALKVGDRILQVDKVPFSEYQKNPQRLLFENVKPGQTINFVVERDGQSLTIPTPALLRDSPELIARLTGQLWIALIFWIFGTIALLLVRPQDERLRLLVYFNNLTALWIMAGTISSTHLLWSPTVLRVAIWFCIPIYWRFHWVFPKPLTPLSGWTKGMVYSIAGILAAAEFLHWVPGSAYFIGFILAVMGSMILLVVHAAIYPDQRRDLGLFAASFGLFVLPAVLVSFTYLVGRVQYSTLSGFLALPALPAAYFYVIYRRQVGGMQVRSNRAVIILLFTFLLISITAGLLGLIQSRFNDISILSFIAGSLVVIVGIVTALSYPSFERWVGACFLGMPIPPTQLLESYATRITTSLDKESLIVLLRDQVMPSLFIRQAALLRLGEDRSALPIFITGLEVEQLPTSSDIQKLLSKTGQFRPKSMENESDLPCPWVRLPLVLSVEGGIVGLLLLGRRDPDDLYAASEIPTLQALAQQTALALLNIDQAERLSSLYQNDIKRQEDERNSLARELHDDVLGQLAMLMMNGGETATTPEFERAYQSAVSHIRQIIDGLRPAMLNYGVVLGIKELTEELSSQIGSEIKVVNQLPDSFVRYPLEVELHLFRIVQEASNNAIRHAKASQILISGRLDENIIELTISDNGKGFEIGPRLDLHRLLEAKHFGLAGIYERAALIGAKVLITSAPQHGTQIRVLWKAS